MWGLTSDQHVIDHFGNDLSSKSFDKWHRTSTKITTNDLLTVHTRV